MGRLRHDYYIFIMMFMSCDGRISEVTRKDIAGGAHWHNRPFLSTQSLSLILPCLSLIPIPGLSLLPLDHHHHPSCPAPTTTQNSRPIPGLFSLVLVPVDGYRSVIHSFQILHLGALSKRVLYYIFLRLAVRTPSTHTHPTLFSFLTSPLLQQFSGNFN